MTTHAPQILRARFRNGNRGGTWRPAAGESRSAARSAAPDVRGAWIGWLSPHFADNDSAYFTGTYSDEYGFANGLMLARNVDKDVRRFLDNDVNDHFKNRRFICGIEKHEFRDILHWHGIIQGPFDDLDRAYLKALWGATRGHCRVLPVTDGCESYVTKYALKGDTECFEWRLA